MRPEEIPANSQRGSFDAEEVHRLKRVMRRQLISTALQRGRKKIELKHKDRGLWLARRMTASQALSHKP